MKVVFLLGSETDKEWASKIQKELDAWKIEYVLHVASAHKVPEKVSNLFLITMLLTKRLFMSQSLVGRMACLA